MARTTVADLEDRLDTLTDTIGKLADHVLTSDGDGDGDKPAASKRGRKKGGKKAAKKADTITRKLDTADVVVAAATIDADGDVVADDGEVTFAIDPTVNAGPNGGRTPSKRGARIAPVGSGGRTLKAWTATHVASLLANADEVIDAIDAVERDAQIGRHLPD